MNKTKPILFSTPMVIAILDGRKTQTRRIMKLQPVENDFDGPYWFEPTITKKNGEQEPGEPIYGISANDGEWGIKCPYQPGDILWVRETTYLYGRWAKNGLTKTGKQKYKFVWDKSQPVIYAADDTPDKICTKKDQVGYFKRPSIFMPREAARIFLKVTNVRAERLQEIATDDVLNEGITVDEYLKMEYSRLRHEFKKLWDSLNAKRGYGWETNPWVWVHEFERISKEEAERLEGLKC